jgi:hypothetical protein
MHWVRRAYAIAIVLLAALAANACSESGTIVATCAELPQARPFPYFPDPRELRPGPAPSSDGFSQAPHTSFSSLPSDGFVAPTVMKLEILVAEGEPLREQLEAFGHAVATSQWWRTVGADYGLPPTIASVIITSGRPLTGYVDDATIEAYVHATSQVPAAVPDATIRMLFLPEGTTVVEDGKANCGCALFAGFHSVAPTGEVYGVAQQCDGPAETQLDNLTVTASHEIIEAATDPLPQRPTNRATLASPLASTGGEVGDLCPSVAYEGEWALSRSWSISEAASGRDPCVPHLDDSAYFNVSAPADSYAIAPGGIVDIPLVAWSSATRPDWYVVMTDAGERDGFKASLATATTETIGAHALPRVNNGASLTLSVTAPATAPPEDAGPLSFTVLEITSVSAVPYITHSWRVGVYVR